MCGLLGVKIPLPTSSDLDWTPDRYADPATDHAASPWPLALLSDDEARLVYLASMTGLQLWYAQYEMSDGLIDGREEGE